MALLLTPTPWTRQPQFPAGLAAGNPIAKGICVVSVPMSGGVLNISPFNVQRNGTKYGSSPTVVPGVSGIGTQITASSADSWKLHSIGNATNTAFELPSTAVTCMAFLVRKGATSGNSPIFGNLDPFVNPYAAWGLVDRSGTDNISFEVGTGSTNYALNSGASFGTAPVLITGTYDGATQRVYKNGVQVGSASVTGTLTYVSSATRGPVIGNFWELASTRAFNGNVYLTALWNRALTPGEVAALSVNPWQIFAPLPRRLWVGAAAAPGGASNAPRYFHRTQAGMS